MRILVIEPDRKMAQVILKALKSEQFAVDLASTANEGLALAKDVRYDAMVLDLSPLAGFSALATLRRNGVAVPIIALNHCNTSAGRARALAAGADECVANPSSTTELLARLRLHLRDPGNRRNRSDKLQVGDLELDSARRQAIRNGRRIALTPKEYGILEYLMRNAGRVVTRSMILEHVWNAGYEGLTNVVDVYINHLRRKIEIPGSRKILHTAHGAGYVLVDSKQE